MIVLCYHKINDLINDGSTITVSPSTFVEQVSYVKNHFKIVPTSADLDEQDSLAISFDDGYKDCVSIILPLLEKFDIPATFFISTRQLDEAEEDWCNELSRRLVEGGKEKPFIRIGSENIATLSIEERKQARKRIVALLKDLSVEERDDYMDAIRSWAGTSSNTPRREYQMMSSEQLRKLSTSTLVTIGAHTVNHQSLGHLDPVAQEYEIVESKKRIQTIIGKEVTQFAYPFGGPTDYTAETIAILKRSGFSRAFSTRNTRISTEREFEIPRISIHEWSLEEFVNKINNPFPGP